MNKRNRRLKSVADELIRKSREAALAAVQIYNNPTITFKSELFIVVMNIAWTYLLHAFFKKTGIDYRHFKNNGPRKSFDRTKSGVYKYWELERCLNEDKCPMDHIAKSNLRFLIGIRHEIEHQMTKRIDSSLSAKFQANCLNFNAYIKKLFGDKFGIDRHLSFSLQFSSIKPEQQEQLIEQHDLPHHIETYIKSFEDQLTDQEFDDQRYAYRVLFVPKTANRKGQADKVIEFVKVDSDLTKTTNAEYEKVYLKEVDKKKYFAKDIVAVMKQESFTKFSIQKHTELWKSLDAKNLSKGFCGQLGQQWYWFESWLLMVRKHCQENQSKYAGGAAI